MATITFAPETDLDTSSRKGLILEKLSVDELLRRVDILIGWLIEPKSYKHKRQLAAGELECESTRVLFQYCLLIVLQDTSLFSTRITDVRIAFGVAKARVDNTPEVQPFIIRNISERIATFESFLKQGVFDPARNSGDLWDLELLNSLLVNFGTEFDRQELVSEELGVDELLTLGEACVIGCNELVQRFSKENCAMPVITQAHAILTNCGEVGLEMSKEEFVRTGKRLIPEITDQLDSYFASRDYIRYIDNSFISKRLVLAKEEFAKFFTEMLEKSPMKVQEELSLYGFSRLKHEDMEVENKKDIPPILEHNISKDLSLTAEFAWLLEQEDDYYSREVLKADAWLERRYACKQVVHQLSWQGEELVARVWYAGDSSSDARKIKASVTKLGIKDVRNSYFGDSADGAIWSSLNFGVLHEGEGIH